MFVFLAYVFVCIVSATVVVLKNNDKMNTKWTNVGLFFCCAFHRNSMSSLRKGNNENRKSIFYTSEEWELLDPTPKDLEDSMALEEKRKNLAEGSKGRNGRKEEELLPFLLHYCAL